MASVLIFNNFLASGQKSVLECQESEFNKYKSLGPGRWQADPYSKKKHMTVGDATNRAISCFFLWVKSSRFDVLVIDSATTALFLGIYRIFYAGNVKVLVSSFNAPRRRSGVWKWIAKVLFSKLDFIFVHSVEDIEIMKKLYGFGDNKIAFRPFVRSTPCVSHKVIDGLDEDIIEKPFILSMGSNGRDYETFFKAIADSGITAVVVSRPYNVYNMSIPDNVVLLSGIKLDDCDYLSSKCLFTVFTFDGTEPSCGQISIVTSLMLGKPVICTDIDGVHDYIVNDYNGLLVNIFNADDLREKILDLYNNCDLYSKLSDGAKLWANDIGSEEAARTLLDKTISKLVCQ